MTSFQHLNEQKQIILAEKCFIGTGDFSSFTS